MGGGGGGEEKKRKKKKRKKKKKKKKKKKPIIININQCINLSRGIIRFRMKTNHRKSKITSIQHFKMGHIGFSFKYI